YAALNPDETQKLIRMVVSEVKAFSLDERQLARVKAQIKSNYVMGLESSSTVMSSIGKSQLLLGRVYTPDEIIGKINAVTLQRIEELKREIFDFTKMSVSAVGCVGEHDLRRMMEDAV
ncbi:MAG: insulinase family protein, partial [Defluviitaleaceae bacterium]|nr:insulinase family protein [Defluviitaleaceae bacterium]